MCFREKQANELRFDQFASCSTEEFAPPGLVCTASIMQMDEIAKKLLAPFAAVFVE
jgi:hypothetical protein